MNSRNERKTCFFEHSARSICCEKKACKYWINNQKGLNCTIITAKNGAIPLHEIGHIMGMTRMRVCQLENKILSKIKNMRAENPVRFPAPKIFVK